MRKILLPVISLVNIILVSIAWGLGAQTAATRVDSSNFGNYYQLVFERGSNAFAVVSFICFIVASVLILFCLIPSKVRKFVLPACAAALIATGVFMLLTPGGVKDVGALTTTGSMVATAVLVLVAGGLACCQSALALTEKKA